VASVDALDFAIYRRLSPDGVARFWASRRLMDPRITAQQIARDVGLSEAGVRGRMMSLRRKGYLLGSEVWVNPSLFGVTVDYMEVPVDDSHEARRLLKDLALVEGVFFARDILDEEDRKVRVHFVSDTPAGDHRRASLIRRLAGRKVFRGPRPYFVPRCDRRMSPLDWRVVRALRTSPDAPLTRVARDAGVHLKTFSRRFHSLLDAHAIWWTHSRATLEMPLALLTVTLRSPARTGDLAAHLPPSFHAWMPVAPDGFGLAPDATQGYEAGLLLTESPAAVESAIHRLLDLPIVAAVRRTFTLGFGVYPEWFDDQIVRKG